VAFALFLGDSHLARIVGEPLDEISRVVGLSIVNEAVGGATSGDLLQQLGSVSGQVAAVVISVGSNDAAPWKAVPLTEFQVQLAAFLDRLSCPAVLMTPPPVDEARLEFRTADRTNAVLATYAAVVRTVGRQRSIPILDSTLVLTPLDGDWHDSDGLHISVLGYEALAPAIGTALLAALSAAPHRGRAGRETPGCPG